MLGLRVDWQRIPCGAVKNKDKIAVVFPSQPRREGEKRAELNWLGRVEWGAVGWCAVECGGVGCGGVGWGAVRWGGVGCGGVRWGGCLGYNGGTINELSRVAS